MTDGDIAFALAGLGMGGGTHARELAKVDGARLAAVYGRDEDKANRFAREFAVPKAYSRFEDLLADPEIDVVSVLTPNGLHGEFAIAAAKAGKHVVVEKPLETTVARALEIVHACEANGVSLGAVFQMRFGEAARRLKATIEDGRMGRLLVADAFDKEGRPPEYYRRDYWRGTRKLEGGGSLITQSIHVIDLLQWLAGPVESIYAKTRTARHAIETEDYAAAILTFRNGATGVLESSTAVMPALKARIEIHGTEGSAIINGEWDETYLWAVADDERIDTPPGFSFTDTDDPRTMPESRHGLVLADVVAAIREGRSPKVDGREALMSVAICEAMYRSAETGAEVSVPELMTEAGVVMP
jgi:UDP-N-acetyl-2-amino-2-deoxyglucuronate dehydrogenase